MARPAPRVKKYVEEKMMGNNKMQSAIVSGYSTETAKHPSLIERTKAYEAKVKEILEGSHLMLHQMMSSLDNDVKSGLFDTLKPETKVAIAYKIAQIHQILTPKITIKEQTNKDGSISRTIWGSNES